MPLDFQNPLREAEQPGNVALVLHFSAGPTPNFSGTCTWRRRGHDTIGSTTLATSQTPDPTPIDARISGRVLDAHDKPVANAIVYAEEHIDPFGDSYRVQATSDRSGCFDFGARLRHGIYELYARKDKDGYPDPNSVFYRPLDFNPETVQLYGERPESKVTVKLGEKAGVITGNVTDADTGRPLEAGIVLVNLQADVRRDQVVEGKFRELLPANTDIDVLVEYTHQDRENWSRFETKVNLQPREEKNLDIRLYHNPAPQ